MPSPLSSRQGMVAAEEQRLLQRARRGDRAAYLSLARLHLRPMYRLAFALTRDADAAAEVVCEAFARGAQGIRYLPEGQLFYPWVARIGRNLATTLLRRKAGTPDPGRVERLPAVRSGALDAATAARYLEAIEALDSDDQLALALKLAEHLGYRDIEAFLASGPGSVMVRLSQARARLDGLLGASGEAAA